MKPSAYAPATSALLAKMVGELFPPEYVAVVTGGREENAALLEEKFDFIFFTGSQSVGREVLRHAAEHLTPTALELGGKSPCIVDETAKLALAARRIVFGKYLNCGQTCVAPDYILCHRDVKDQLVELICKEVRRQYGEEPLQNPDYGRIVNEKHFNRLLGLIDPAKTVLGGQSSPDTLQIAPTVLDGVTESDPVMGEEIFGPILPVLTFDRFEELYDRLSGPSRWPCTCSPRPAPASGRPQPASSSAAGASTTWSSTWRPAPWASAAWGKAAWGPTTAGRASRRFPTARASWTKRPGWICPCATSPTGRSCTADCCTCFCGE